YRKLRTSNQALGRRPGLRSAPARVKARPVRPQKEGMKPPKVYIDTNVLKFSATQLPRLKPRQTTINWGGHIHDVTVHDFIEVNPNDTISNQELKSEAQLLLKLAELGKSGKVQYAIQMETLLESWGIPNMDSSFG